MIRRCSFLAILALCGVLRADAAEPWKVALYDAGQGVSLTIDLVGESVVVPGMEMYGPMAGYMCGRSSESLYGTWVVTSFKIVGENKASIRLSNDLGSETQQALLTADSDSTYSLKLEGQMVMKRVANKKKLVKVGQVFNFKRSLGQ